MSSATTNRKVAESVCRVQREHSTFALDSVRDHAGEWPAGGDECGTDRNRAANQAIVARFAIPEVHSERNKLVDSSSVSLLVFHPVN